MLLMSISNKKLFFIKKNTDGYCEIYHWSITQLGLMSAKSLFFSFLSTKQCDNKLSSMKLLKLLGHFTLAIQK